ncbi:DUF927 domain-containing protein [Streptomyces misionensis]|uniref:DUF927 domain-containing protein n=1 Tax=Streptomyces misionensis TaxID=67331 RepID=UPI0033F7E986
MIGQVPEIVATITHLTDDGEDIRTEYLARGKRQRRPRILTEDELDRGTWAAKMGCRRPTGSDEKHAFARLIREEGDKAPVVPARTYYNEAGDLIFPEANAQTLGYRVLRGEEEAARAAWEEIGAWTLGCGKSALVIGAVFAGPVLDSLDVLAHMVNCYGPGQQGKSTIATVACAAFGDIKPRRQQILITWNSSKQGITQSLRQRGFLPIGLDEHSSSGRRIHESSREISQMVSGAVRAMGTADGSPKESDGFWLSCALSTSNEPLKHEGQTEDLATRLQEFQAPFFPNVLLLPDGTAAPAGHPGAEHVSKRLKRLAKGFGGWPLEWAIRKGMFRAQNLAQLKKLHLELCAKHRPAQGGIAATIAELHMAWVVGAHMFAEAIGVPGLGLTAEDEAVKRLQAAIVQADEANVPDHERLWNALDSLRIEAASFPEMEQLPAIAEEGRTRLRGFHQAGEGLWWVIDPVVRQAGAEAGVDNVTAALRELDALGVHIRDKGKHSQRQLPKAIRNKGLGIRMHCFNTWRAAELFAPDDGSEDGPQGGSGGEFPSGTTPGNHPGTTGVVPENEALTCGGTTGTTGTTLELFDFSMENGTTPETTPIPDSGTAPSAAPIEDVAAPQRHDVTMAVPPMPSAPPAVPYPPARMIQPGEAGHDRAWLSLESRAQGRTRTALAVGVLGADGLYLPNHAPVEVPLPDSVDDVPALMTAYGLKTLWVHSSALAPLGLPTYEERRALGAAQERAAKGLSADEPVKSVGPMSPVAHPWAVPAAGSPVTEVVPEGLTAWMTLKLADTASGLRRLTVAIPAYEDRFDKAKQQGRGGFGGAPTPEVLLDALMVWTLSTVHGTQERPKVIPYYLSPNRTGEDFAGGRDRDDVVCRAVRDKAVPPALGVRLCPLMVPQQWHRDPSEAERAATWLHRYDKTAAWLAAYGPTKLGVGEPTHGGEGTLYNKAMAGFWRVADVPGAGPEGLPELQFREVEEGGYWLTTPSVELLRELYPAWTPRVLESWHWETSKAALSGMYKLMSTSRTRIVASAENGHPGAKWAKQVNGRIYQSFRGYLARAIGPQTDHATGGDYQQDIYYRPDWAAMLISHATSNMYRNLVRFAAEDGRYPLSVYVDAVTLTSDQADPIAAKPDSMVIGNRGGNWTAEGSAPMAELLPLLDDRDNRHGAHSALDQYLNRGE